MIGLRDDRLLLGCDNGSLIICRCGPMDEHKLRKSHSDSVRILRVLRPSVPKPRGSGMVPSGMFISGSIDGLVCVWREGAHRPRVVVRLNEPKQQSMQQQKASHNQINQRTIHAVTHMEPREMHGVPGYLMAVMSYWSDHRRKYARARTGEQTLGPRELLGGFIAYRANDGQEMLSCRRAHDSACVAMALLKKESILCTGSAAGDIKLWSIRTDKGRVPGLGQIDSGSITAMTALSHHSFVSSDDAGVVIIWQDGAVAAELRNARVRKAYSQIRAIDLAYAGPFAIVGRRTLSEEHSQCSSFHDQEQTVSLQVQDQEELHPSKREMDFRGQAEMEQDEEART